MLVGHSIVRITYQVGSRKGPQYRGCPAEIGTVGTVCIGLCAPCACPFLYMRQRHTKHSLNSIMDIVLEKCSHVFILGVLFCYFVYFSQKGGFKARFVFPLKVGYRASFIVILVCERLESINL